MDEIPSNNALIVETIEIMNGITIKMLKVDYEPRLQMVLVIDNNTDFDAINKNRNKLKSFLKDLDEVQGSDLNQDYETTVYSLWQWHKEDISWKNMMLTLNYLALALAIMAYEESQAKADDLPKLGKKQHHLSDARFVAGIGGTELVYIFRHLRMAIVDFDRWMKQVFFLLDGEDQHQLGITNEPFSINRIRDQVRYFQKKIDTKRTFLIEDDLPMNNIERKIYDANLGGYFSKTDEFLDRSGMKDWKRNKKFLQTRVKEIIKKWETSTDKKIAGWRYIKNSGKI